MSFTIYKSTDASAPVLTGQTGKLVDLLDACLVNGYGAKAAAGWAVSFTGTSKRAYRGPSGARLYYRIQDDGPGAGTFKEARLTGYETMSDVDTGTGPFPTAAQGVGSVAMYPIRKSTSADATARAWIVAADARTVYVWVATGDTAGTYHAFGFGEIYSLVSGDAYNGFTIGRIVENSGTAGNERLEYISITNTTQTDMAVARGHLGTGGSVQMNKHGDATKSASASGMQGILAYTNAPDGGLYLSPIWILDFTTSGAKNIRGRMRGFWHFLHATTNVADLDTVTGTGDLAGKTFLFIKLGGQSGLYTIETSDTLETN